MRKNSNVASQGIKIGTAPIETPGAIGTVERYHAPLRAAFESVEEDLRKRESRDHNLRPAVFTVNSTVSPEGLCPALLYFGFWVHAHASAPDTISLSSAEVDRSAKGDRGSRK